PLSPPCRYGNVDASVPRPAQFCAPRSQRRHDRSGALALRFSAAAVAASADASAVQEDGAARAARMRSDPLLGRVTPPDLHVMTLNVRRRLGVFAWPPADRWPKRAPRLRALLANERPSLLGVQEALPSQVAVMQEALGSAYRYVGHGRGADQQGEGCPIL